MLAHAHDVRLTAEFCERLRPAAGAFVHLVYDEFLDGDNLPLVCALVDDSCRTLANGLPHCNLAHVCFWCREAVEPELGHEEVQWDYMSVAAFDLLVSTDHCVFALVDHKHLWRLHTVEYTVDARDANDSLILKVIRYERCCGVKYCTCKGADLGESTLVPADHHIDGPVIGLPDVEDRVKCICAPLHR